MMQFARRIAGFPVQCYRRDGKLTADLRNAFTVGHNAGDSAPAARAALEYGAHVIEIDVISRGGQLFAGHPRRGGFFSRLALPVTPLHAAWEALAKAPAIKLDLKDSSPEFVALVAKFLDGRRSVPTLAVTREIAVLAGLQSDAPWVLRVLSVPNARLDSVLNDERAPLVLDGISGHPSIYVERTMGWLRENHLLALSSVVNSFPVADRLVRVGVNGVITDNLALIEAMKCAGGMALLDRTERRRLL